MVTEREWKLEKIRVGFERVIPSYILDAEAEMLSLEKEKLLLQIQGYVWGNKLEKRVIEHPANWRESLKERWFPAWAKTKWPVVYTKHIWDITVIYPEIVEVVPSDEKYLILAQVNCHERSG